MTMPINLVLVRHGESEGNAAKRRSDRGDHSAFTPDFVNRHTASYRLTKKGRGQAKAAGAWLRSEFYGNGRTGFDRFITSEYARAMETAGLLALPGASWYCNFNLRERDWGELDSVPPHEREERFGQALRGRNIEPFFWRPPNGESLAELCVRFYPILDTLHRECSDKSVVVVCHGEVMWAWRVILERMMQHRFKELHQDKDRAHKIFNCQVLHYTRRDPATGNLAKYTNWVRSIRPTETPIQVSDWTEITRPKYTSGELLELVEHIPAMVK